MNLYAKHATLINNCYPEKEGENKPRASELSYLVFYASSRPVKLTKVGVFLEKKVEKDASRGRKQNNHVTLDIIKSLVHSCHRDLNLFSKYVVKIIQMMLQTKDIELIDHACQVFVAFTEYHDGSTLGVDSDFTNDYEALLSKFAEFCSFDSTNELLKLQMRYSGQRSLQAAVTSSALQVSNYKAQLDLILNPLIVTLSNTTNPADALAQSNENADIRQSAISHETLNSHSIDILAAKTFALLFSKANGIALKQSLAPIFLYVNEKHAWWPSNFIVSMIKLVLHSLQPQYSYLLVSEVVQQLSNTKAENEECLKKRASLVSSLDAILNANVPLVGISVLEVLSSLFTQLTLSLNDSGQKFLESKPSNEIDALHYSIHHGLVCSIGGLASQTYYVNQLNDITAFIVSKIRINNNGSDTVDELPIVEYRKAAIKCLQCVVISSIKKTEKDDTESENAFSYKHSINLDTFIPIVCLLLDDSAETRTELAYMFVSYFDATAETDIGLSPYPKHTLTHQGDISLVDTIYQTILDWVQLPTIEVQDILAINKLLAALTRRFGADATIRAVPLVFEIQSLVKQTVIKTTSRQRAVAALVVEWLLMVAEFYSIDSLYEYMQTLKTERIDSGEYSVIFLQDTSVDTIDELESENKNIVDKFIDRKQVVDLLSKDGPLRDEEDTDGTELEAKLNADWDVNTTENHSSTFRIRTSRNLSDLKAKLVTPWSSNTEIAPNDQEKRKTIKVENLKEVLIGQSLSEGTSLDSMSYDCLSKKSADPFMDMSSLLQSISSGNSESKPSTLFNPPYKL
ncbi:hypothetical protein BCV72DRAFT_254967 [Rhizopus microsporus var. microsporus]|uniref:Protein EFR3 n=2 Tax=Rhizopus microsporus TaxID=58291 RepID=A0A2G4T2V7_RHIZD|nr:uncharacterized protein RHIMIDRAFT_290597 [Rhizopus microsporus ATCC 52813]ORE09142.1 hypothetical protein BCV72DRAFT_254967 [Rhizopus microsporus var. microsporus]PHZ15006.1 hypothetical protein RHIMIDRAFT_290597 [Rhizopus microsporus ATCC 52813]